MPWLSSWLPTLWTCFVAFAYVGMVYSADVRQYKRLVGKLCQPPGVNTLTAQIDGIVYCPYISPGGTFAPKQSNFILPISPYLPLQKTQNCKLDFTCPENTNAILSSDGAFFRCTCAENFGRINGTCQACTSTQFSPVYSDHCFVCPQHTSLARLDPSRDEFNRNIYDVEYCMPDTGFKLVSAIQNIGALLQENLQAQLYTAEPCVLCQKQTVCDTRLMRGTSVPAINPTPCLPGSYRPRAGSVECVTCPRPFYCTGSATFSACPTNEHTLKDGASDMGQCVCRDAGVFRSKTTKACQKIVTSLEYSPLCTSYDEHIRRWCEGKYPCGANMKCAQGVLSYCSPGMFLDPATAACKLCPRGYYCFSGKIRACPPGSTTVATMSPDASYCHCYGTYTHETNAHLESGFSCQIAGPGIHSTKQILVKSSQSLSNSSQHYSMMFHMKKYSTAIMSSDSGVLSINAETRELSCYFMSDAATLSSNTSLAVQSIRYTMVTNVYPLMNSEIVSATLRRVSSETSTGFQTTISLQLMILNRFDGIVYCGSIQGVISLVGSFVLMGESWELKYHFHEVASFNIHSVPAMHMLIAIHQTSSVLGSTEIYYNLIVMREENGPPSIASIGLPNGTYNLSHIQMTLDANYTRASFGTKDVFHTIVGLDPWIVVSHDLFPSGNMMTTANPYTVPALHGLRLSTGVEIDIFDAFSAHVMFFTHPLTKRFGILTAQYEPCGLHQSTHYAVGFSCECDPGYTKHPHSNTCIQCDTTKETCCRTPQECASKQFQCVSGYFVSVSGECQLCPENTFCHGGRKFHCPENSFNPWSGSFHISSCKCNDGYFLRSSECKPCPSLLFCHSNQVFECPANMQTTIPTATKLNDCQCSPGFFVYLAKTGCEPVSRGQYWIAGTTAVPVPSVQSCSPRMTTAFTHSIGQASCRCMPGYKADTATGVCVQCVGLHEACYFDSRVVICPALSYQRPSRLHDQCVCENGYYDKMGHTQGQKISCTGCPSGYYCSSNDAAGIVKCPPKMTSPARSPSLVFCECQTKEQVLTYNRETNSSECQCDRRFYSDNTRCTYCPPHMHVLPQNSSQVQRYGVQTCSCISGYMMVATGCVLCPAGFVCDNRVEQSRESCPLGTFSPIPGLQTIQQCLSCGMKRSELTTEYAKVVWTNPRTSHESCLGGFIAIRSLVQVNVVASVFKFTVASDVLKVSNIQAMVSTLLDTDAYDIAYEYNNQLQFTVTMHPTFVNACMSVLVQYPGIWSKIVLASQQHAMTYVYVAHGIFCSIFSAAAQQLYASNMRGSFCFTPFHPSKFAAYPSTQTIVAEFMQKKRNLFPGATILIPGSPMVNNIYTSNEVVQIHNFFNAILPSHEANRIVILPVQGSTLAVFADGANSTLSSISSPVLRNSFRQMQSVSTGSMYFQLAECAPAVYALLGACTAAVHDTSSAMCKYCEPDVSFFSLSDHQCKVCTLPGEGQCSACCQNKDVSCIAPTKPLSAAELCGNIIHDFSEECDESDLNSPLRACCTNCQLDQGFYSDPPCTTRCGDFVVAIGIEECDSPGDFTCDMFQCKNVTRNPKNEL